MRGRDAAATVLGVGAFFASWIVELICGADTARCTAPWPASDTLADYTSSYHCTPANGLDRGLGDPALSVSSLAFAAALPYLYFDSRFTVLPIVATFLGISSFLFHAQPDVLYHRLDLTGCALLAPALADAVAGAPTAADPISTLLPKPKPWLRAVAFLPPVIVLAVTHPTAPTWSPFWVITLIYGVLFLALSVRVFSWRAAALPGAVLVTGLVLLQVGNGPQYWSCVATQLGEPHYWAHLLIAAAVALIARTGLGTRQLPQSAAVFVPLADLGGQPQLWAVDPSGLAFFVAIAAAGVAGTSAGTAGIILTVSAALQSVAAAAQAVSSGARYDRKCTYWSRHVAVDAATLVVLGLAVAAIVDPDGAGPVTVAVGAGVGILTAAVAWTEEGTCFESSGEWRFLD